MGRERLRLYHDNYLAAKVLDRTEPDLAGKIRDAIEGSDVTGSGKFDILFGEPPGHAGSMASHRGARRFHVSVVGSWPSRTISRPSHSACQT